MSVIDALKHRVHESFKSAAELVIPVRSSSAFREQGVLTPEEFVAAGDFLVRTCPTWAWDGGKPAKRKPFLPPDKQFLVTKNVPCLRRADDDGLGERAGAAPAGGDARPEEELEDEWIAPAANAGEGAGAEGAADMDEIGSASDRARPGEAAGDGGDEDEDDEDVPDMDDFDDNNIVDCCHD